MFSNHKIIELCHNHDNNFNLIRMMSAWGVLFAHSFILVNYKPNLMDPFQWYFSIGMGTFFVTVFFSISGFLIFRSLDRSRSLKRYFWSRSKRIIPALTVVLLITVFILGPFSTEEDLVSYFSNPKTWNYLTNINLLDIKTQFELPGVFQQNAYPGTVNGSLWTLPIETWMYIVTAIVFSISTLANHYIKAWSKPAGIFVLIGFYVLACKIAAYLKITQQAEYFSILLCVCTYITGSTLYYFRAYIPIQWPVGAILLAGIPWVSDIYIYPIYFSITVTYCVLIFAYLPKGTIRHYNKIGDYSYGLYIYAFPIQQLIALVMPNINFYQMFIISTVLSLFFSILSWHYIESPILRSK